LGHFNGEITDSAYFLLRIDIDEQLTLFACRFSDLLLTHFEEDALKEVKFL
jgi:hypothetical protein